MPRFKHVFTEEHALLYIQIAAVKGYYPDLLLDAKTIYEMQLQRLGGWMLSDDFWELKQRLQELSKLKLKPQHSTRVYIVTEGDYFSFVMLGMDECVVKNLRETYEVLNDFPSADNYVHLNEISPYYRSALYIFIENEVSRYELSAEQLATLMVVFRNENLVDFSGARYNYYGRPRRSQRG